MATEDLIIRIRQEIDGKGIKDLRTDLSAVTKEMDSLVGAGKRDSETYSNLIKVAGDLTQKITILKNEYKGLSESSNAKSQTTPGSFNDIKQQIKSLQDYKGTLTATDPALKETNSKIGTLKNSLKEFGGTSKTSMFQWLEFGENLTVVGAGISMVFGKVKQYIGEAIMMALEYEKVQNRLNYALQNVNINPNKIKDYNQQFQFGSVYSGKEIMGGEAFLAQQGRTEEQIKKVIKAAMDLSVVTGDDLLTSIHKLDATYEGSIGKMGKLEGSLKDLSKEQLENGAAVDILGKKYQGFADNELNTTSGKIAVMRKNYDELKRSMGEAALIELQNIFGVQASSSVEKTAMSFKTLEYILKGIVFLLGEAVRFTTGFGDLIDSISGVTLNIKSWFTSEKDLQEAVGATKSTVKDATDSYTNYDQKIKNIVSANDVVKKSFTDAVVSIMKFGENAEDVTSRVNKMKPVFEASGMSAKDLGQLMFDVGMQAASGIQVAKGKQEKYAAWFVGYVAFLADMKMQIERAVTLGTNVDVVVKSYSIGLNQMLGEANKNFGETTAKVNSGSKARSNSYKEEKKELDAIQQKQEDINKVIEKQNILVANQGEQIKDKTAYLDLLDEEKKLRAELLKLQSPPPKPKEVTPADITFDTAARIGIGPSEKVKDPDKPIREAKEKSAQKINDSISQGVSLSQQIANNLGMGADTFIGKMLSGLSNWLGLANSLLSFLANIGTGGASGGIFGLIGGLFGFAEGGLFRGYGSGRSDSNLIKISDWEFIVNSASTKKHLPLLRAINQDALPAFAGGGLYSKQVNETITSNIIHNTNASGGNIVIVGAMDGQTFFKSNEPRYREYKNSIRVQ